MTAWQLNVYVYYLVYFVTVATTAASPDLTRKTYDGDVVLRVDVPTTQAWASLQDVINYKQNTGFIELWRPPSIQSATSDVHVCHHLIHNVTEELHRKGMSYTHWIHDVQELINQNVPAQNNFMHHRFKRSTHQHENIIGDYVHFDQILEWLQHLNKRYSDSVVLESLGESFEGRPMQAIKIGLPGKASKPAIWLDAGFHAREWITHATAVYVIHKLIQGLRNESSAAHWLLQNLDFYILPVANPDGYVYTFTKDRLWRKNRRPITANCTGVDINRNFEFQWGQGHTSLDPCSIMYRGDRPETELETQHMVKFLMAHSDSVLAYVTLHSYMQHFYTRYDYAPGHYPNDHQTLLSLAQRAADAMSAENGSTYHVGTAADILYSYGGGSADWAKAIANIKYSYLIELRDGGKHGFLLPRDQIIPTGQETWAGLLIIAKELIHKYAKPQHSPTDAKAAMQTPNTDNIEIEITSELSTDDIHQVEVSNEFDLRNLQHKTSKPNAMPSTNSACCFTDVFTRIIFISCLLLVI